MFSFLSKKNKIKEDDYIFFKAIVKELSLKYPYLKEQVSEEFILDKKPNKLGDKHTYTFTLNANLETKYSNKSLPQFFIIKDIKVWDSSKSKFENLELHILEGMLAGYRLESNYENLDLDRIKVSEVKEKRFENNDKDELMKILKFDSDKYLKFIDVENTFKIEVDSEEFYVIKDLGDGNYISIDINGAIYGMIHDPYEIEKLYNNKESFFNDLELGIFNFRDYYSKKL